jgi:hypothetical protein
MRNDRRPRRDVEAITATEDASVSISQQDGEGVERAEGRRILELFDDSLMQLDDALRGMTTPGSIKRPFIVGSGSFTPRESYADEEGVGNSLHG